MTMMRHLILITAIFLGSIVSGCSTSPALHVIGVYEGETPPGVDDRPWWAKCNDGKKAQRLSPISTRATTDHVVTTPHAAIECHQKYAGKHAEKEVSVTVSDDSRPIVLALTAYDKTHWKVSLKKGVMLTKVILAGYHSQRVSGIPTEMPIETYTYEPSPCEHCWQGAKYFYSYERPPKQLKEISGLDITSFQGRYKGSEFSIFPGMKKVESSH